VIARRLPPTWSPLTARAVLGARRSAAQAREDQQQLRRLLRQRHGARDLLLTDSGTSALRLAFTAATSRGGASNLVALPAWSCYDLATAADGAGADVILYDLDPATLGPDWDSFEAALSHDPAAVVIVHPFGIPVTMNAVRQRTAARGTLVIEDAAQAVSAEIEGLPVGSHGDMAILSFGRGKGWTGGSGGALLLGKYAPADLTLPGPERLASPPGTVGILAKSLVQWALGRPALYALPASLPFLGLGRTVYHPPHVPSRPTDAMAALLLAVDPLLDEEVATRRKQAARLRATVESSGAGVVPGQGTGNPSWLRLPFLPSDRLRRRLDGSAGRRLGILQGYPIPLARLPGFADRLLHQVPAPGAEQLAARLHTIPTHSLLTEGDLRRIERWLTAS
jgi:dTDP-4-amino-4,6-dideoxygalactose transaminase